jgi:tetratricopeptide (TPR) repeat protein
MTKNRCVGWMAALVVLGGAALVRAQGRTGASTPGQDAFDEGMKAFNSDDFATAEQKFKDAISQNSGLTDAFWRLSTIYYRNKQYKQAVDLLRKCPDQANLDVKENLGLNLFKTASPPPAEAVRLLEEVVKVRPDSFAAQAKLGEFYLKSEPQKAADAFKAYFKSRPASAAALDGQVHMLLGTALVLAKNYDEAQKEFDGLLKTNPNDLTAKLMLGAVFVGKGSCSQAITLYERLLGEAQKQPSIYLNLGGCYLKSNRSGDAQREAELYTRAKPQDPKGHILLGDARFEQKNFAGALSAFQAAERLDTLSGPIKSRIGKTYLAQKNYAAAKTVLEQAAAAQPNDLEVLGGLVEVYLATNVPFEQLRANVDKLAAASKDAHAQMSAGLAYFTHGKDEKAEECYKNAVALDPNSGAARLQLAKVYNRRAGVALEKNDTARAEQLLTDAQKLVPDDLMTNRNLALTFILLKRWVDAADVLGRILKKVPNDMVVNRLLARAYLGMGKKDQAMAAYEKAAQIALRVRGPDLAGVYAELGPLYVENNKLDQAITVLEQAVREGGPTTVVNAVQRNLAIAYFKRGLERLRDPKQAEGALDDITHAVQVPKGVLTAKEMAAVSCGEAFAALKANKVQDAQEALARAQQAGGCALKPPYDKLGVAFFAAYANYRDSGSPPKREAAVKVFTQLSARAASPAGDWLKSLVRSAYELLAYDYYQKSDEKRAEQYLKSAQRVPAKGDRRELDHNLAVLDLAAGRTAQAEKVLDALNGRPPESLVNLGIVRDKQGEAKKALELYKRAMDKGARAPKLREWIDVKERLFEVKS